MKLAKRRFYHRNSQREALIAQAALVALLLLCGLAFIATNSHLADRVTLLAIGVGCALMCWIPPLVRRLQASPERVAFVLSVIMFVVYGLARTVGPDEGFSLRFAALPGDQFVVPYSAYIVVLGAILTGPYWWFYRLNWTRCVLAGMVLVGLLSLFAFSLLRQYFPTGPTAILDPSPLPPLAMRLVEYGSLALLCHAVAIRRQTRRLALRILPAFVLLLWARHQFMVPAEENE